MTFSSRSGRECTADFDMFSRVEIVSKGNHDHWYARCRIDDQQKTTLPLLGGASTRPDRETRCGSVHCHAERRNVRFEVRDKAVLMVQSDTTTRKKGQQQIHAYNWMTDYAGKVLAERSLGNNLISLLTMPSSTFRSPMRLNLSIKR